MSAAPIHGAATAAQVAPVFTLRLDTILRPNISPPRPFWTRAEAVEAAECAFAYGRMSFNPDAPQFARIEHPDGTVESFDARRLG